MKLADSNIMVISHAGIKRINRAVYREMKFAVGHIALVVPESLWLASNQRISYEPTTPEDPEIIPLVLIGRNPRTYYYPRLLHVLDQMKPSVLVLENDPVSRLGWQLSLWCKRNKAVFICQSYENLRRDVRSTVSRFGWKGLLKNFPIHVLNFYMARRTDGMLVVNSLSEEIFKTYGYRNVKRMPLGYDPKVFFSDAVLRREKRTALGIDDDTLIVAYFGRIVPQKGVHLLIGALAGLKEFNWKLLLDHAHDNNDSYTHEIIQLIDMNGLVDRVVYFDADHFEIAEYMRAADVMAAPSVSTVNFVEQYGRAVQEAMACGCITVVSDSGHLKDLVRERSLTFPESNVSALQQILKRLMSNNSELMGLSKTLAERARFNYTIEVQSQELQKLIANLIT